MTTTELAPGKPQSLSALVERTGGLYSLPSVAMEVLELTKDPEVDAHKLKACLERDAALTARLLRVVNSSLFGLSREVTDLGQAVAILGAQPLKLLVLGFSLPDALFAELAHDVLASYWQTTLCKAVAARAIGDRYFGGRGDEGLIVGLLQDVGLLVLLQQLQTPFVKFVEKASEAGVDLLSAERRTLGFDHTQLSRRLLDAWRLPESIVYAVEAEPEHLEQLSSRAATLHKIVTAAGLVARVVTDRSPETLQQLLQTDAFRRVSFDQLRTFVVDLRDQVLQLADVLNISWSGELSYEQMLLDAQSRMASASVSVLTDVIRSREDSLAAQYDEKQLWSAFGMPTKPAPQPKPAPAATPATNKAEPRRPKPAGQLEMSRELEFALAAAISASRQERSGASLIIAAADGYQPLFFTSAALPADELERTFTSAARTQLQDRLSVIPLAEQAFAIVVPHCERSAAIDNATRVLSAVRQAFTLRFGPSAAQLQLASGVATVSMPHKSFQGAELFAPACRCLAAARSAGADAVKSIEIY